jgi:hypothetical protein
VNEQVLAEIYANAIAQGVNPLMSSDNPFSDEWKRQVGYYGHNPIIDDRTPFATADYRPYFRFLDQWWRKYKPPVIEEEEELEEEKPVEKVLEEIISEGGGDRVASDGFTDMRDPAFMGRESYPGMKDGQWLGGNLGWKDAAQMLGTMKGGLGGLLSGMLNGSLSTYGSPSGKEAIGNIADALGVNKDMALAEIGKALGYSDPATAKRDTSILGQLFGGKPGTPNVKGMMAGTLAGYPNTWDNPTFNNIVNERATIAGVLDALATPDFDWGLAGVKGNWSNPSAISGFVNMANNLGVDLVGMQNKDQLGMWNTIAELMGATAAYDPKVNGLIQALYKIGGTPMAKRASKGELDSSDLGLMASSAIGNPWGGLRDEMKSGKFDNFDKVARDYLDAKDRLGKINKAVEKSRSGEGGGNDYGGDGIGGTGYGDGGSRGDVGDFDGTGGTEAEHEANDPEAKNA